MKRTLLFFATVLMGLSTFAQWTKPTISPSDYAAEFKTSTMAVTYADATKGDSIVGDSTIYYLYNIEGEGFLNGGTAPKHSQWATNAVLKDEGIQIMVVKYELEEVASENNTANVGSSTPAEWDGKSYILKSYWNGWKGVIITSANGSFIDRTSQIDYKWEIEPQGGGVYYIKTADVNPNYNDTQLGIAKSYFGFDGLDPDFAGATDPIKAITPAIDISGENGDVEPHIKWAFVTEEVYKAHQEKVAIYNAAVDLKASIDYALGQGVSAADLAEYQAVYDKNTSSLEDLQKASALAYDKGRWLEIKVYFDNIKQGEKNDVSGVFTNNDFSDGTANGWDITYTKNSTAATNIGYQNNSVYTNGEVKIEQFIEAWKNTNSPNYLGDGSITQTIPSLPAGTYMLAVDVIANNQGRKTDASNPNGYPDDVELFAEASLDGTTYKTNLYTKNGQPEHFQFTFAHTGGSMKLGLRVVNSAEAKMPANWIAMDNLQLFYYGASSGNLDKDIFDASLANLLEALPLEDLDDLLATKSYKDTYKELVEGADKVTEGYEEYTAKIKEAIDNINASAAAYQVYSDSVDLALTEVNTNDDMLGDDADFLFEYLDSDEGPSEDYPRGGAAYILYEQTLTTEEIIDETHFLTAILDKAVKNALHDGSDLTSLLKNPGFDEQPAGTGWTVKNQTGNISLRGGLATNYCAEVWNGTFDVYQEVEGLPNGLYEVSVNAFYRTGTNDAAWSAYTTDPEGEAAKVHTYVYLNEFSTPVRDLMSITYTENLEDNCVSHEVDGETVYTLNGMNSASHAFALEDDELNFKQVVYGLVTDGKMRLGIRNLTGTAFDRWSLWDNFKLIYRAKNADAVASVLEAKTAELDALLTANDAILTTPAKQTASDAKAKGTAAQDGEELYEALIAVNAAQVYVLANIDSVNAVNAAKKTLAAAADSLKTTDGYEATDAFKAYQAIEPKVADAAVAALDNDELGQLAKEIAEVQEALEEAFLEARTATASDEKPADYTKAIINADIAEEIKADATEGWLYTKEAQNGPNLVNGIGGTRSIEFWNELASGLKFNIYQILTELPAGTYELTADAANALNGLSAGTTNGGIYLYAVTTSGNGGSTHVDVTDGNATDAKNYSVIFKVEEGDSVYIGFKNVNDPIARWFAADNFKLTYYGTASAKTLTEDAAGIVTAVEKIAEPTLVAAPVTTGIYTISGARVATLQKGINIIRYSDGSVRKVLVK